MDSFLLDDILKYEQKCQRIQCNQRDAQAVKQAGLKGGVNGRTFTAHGDVPTVGVKIADNDLFKRVQPADISK